MILIFNLSNINEIKAIWDSWRNNKENELTLGLFANLNYFINEISNLEIWVEFSLLELKSKDQKYSPVILHFLETVYKNDNRNIKRVVLDSIEKFSEEYFKKVWNNRKNIEEYIMSNAIRFFVNCYRQSSETEKLLIFQK